MTFDETPANGQPIHGEWIGKFDGQDYPATGYANHDTDAFTQIDRLTFERVDKKQGRIYRTRKIVISADGRSFTNFTTVRQASGDTTYTQTVYDKQ